MSASTASQAFCPICKEDIQDPSDNWVAVQWKGATGINEASVKQKDDLVVETNTRVHKSSRQQYMNYKNIKSHLAKKSSVSVPAKRNTRQSSGGFDSEKDCIFSGCTIDLVKGHFCRVRTDKFVETILEVCESRSLGTYCKRSDWILFTRFACSRWTSSSFL